MAEPPVTQFQGYTFLLATMGTEFTCTHHTQMGTDIQFLKNVKLSVVAYIFNILENQTWFIQRVPGQWGLLSVALSQKQGKKRIIKKIRRFRVSGGTVKKNKKNHNTELFVYDSTVKGHFLTLGALGRPDPCAECLDSVPFLSEAAFKTLKSQKFI